jgi:ElaB/YqjD/DUF883 family membrane-anchored ribosome-binding protein
MKNEDLKKEVAMDVMEALKGKMSDLSSDAKDYATEVYEKTGKAINEVCDKTGKTIKANPWKAVGIAACTGFLVGWFMTRSK